jgi:hypothetical protein
MIKQVYISSASMIKKCKAVSDFIRRFYLIICIAALQFNSDLAYSQTQKEIEYRLKAAYLFNFIQFVEWPPEVFENEESPIIIAVLGIDPFGKILDETIQNEKIGNHPIVIKRFRYFSQLEFCHVLYISYSERGSIRSILNRIKDSSILTVSDINDFGSYGGNISFYLEENKLRFAINLQTLDQADLKVSSKLLRLAKVINPL